MTMIRDVVATYWTLAGQVLPASGNEVSPFDFRSRVEAAAAAGYKGMGFVHDDLEAVRKSIGYPEMHRILAANGIDDVEVELIGDWFADGERRAKSDAVRGNLLSAASALGARRLKICGDAADAQWPKQVLIDAFAALCSDFGKLGMKVGIEIMPWTNFSTIVNTMEIVEPAGTPNGGLFLDIWHMERGGIDLKEIGDLDPRYIIAVEINDARADVEGSLFHDTITNRLLPGEGSFDIKLFLAELKRAGYSGSCGVEILSDQQRLLPLAQAAQVAIDASRPYLD
jgi:sugar phosphate isomerase/epimerase